MARKVFISFLGTNNYLETYYSFEGKKSKPVRFIQEALIDAICSDWEDTDKILIFCTEESCNKNWIDNGQQNIKEEIERIGLEHRLKDGSHFNLVERCTIPEGFSESEIWNIFNIVYDKIEEGDEIYFDVTHAFRSIPMFSVVLFNYAQFMKSTKIVSIRYGAFEKLGPAYMVRNMPLENRIAPIIDLTNLVRLQTYTNIASSMKTFGRINSLGQVLQNEHSAISPIIDLLIKAINDFDKNLSANRMANIKSGKCIIEIRNSIKPLNRLDIPTPIKKVVMQLKEELSDFVAKDSYQNIEAAIAWAIKYKMLPQAYTLGQEYIISLLVNKYKDRNPYTEHNRNKLYRGYMGAICGISAENVLAHDFKAPLAQYLDLAQQLLAEDCIKRLRPQYAAFTKCRNYLDHATGDLSYDEIVSNFNVSFYPCINIINSKTIQ